MKTNNKQRMLDAIKIGLQYLEDNNFKDTENDQYTIEKLESIDEI